MKYPDATSYPAMMRFIWGSPGFWIGFVLSNGALVMIMAAHTVGFGLGVLIVFNDAVNQKCGSVIGAVLMGALSFTRGMGGGISFDCACECNSSLA